MNDVTAIVNDVADSYFFRALASPLHHGLLHIEGEKLSADSLRYRKSEGTVTAAQLGYIIQLRPNLQTIANQGNVEERFPLTLVRHVALAKFHFVILQILLTRVMLS